MHTTQNFALLALNSTETMVEYLGGETFRTCQIDLLA